MLILELFNLFFYCMHFRLFFCLVVQKLFEFKAINEQYDILLKINNSMTSSRESKTK